MRVRGQHLPFAVERFNEHHLSKAEGPVHTTMELSERQNGRSFEQAHAYGTLSQMGRLQAKRTMNALDREKCQTLTFTAQGLGGKFPANGAWTVSFPSPRILT